ncbi:iron transporter FeoA [Vallitalea longa]|uniref:Iron transporter FeoA n=1 Tax=Vallitalea longa TaxID=2936439 RepID=A0A9W5Y773_9FIRM|nr:iron transporter FeoA [Vallitalea longa]
MNKVMSLDNLAVGQVCQLLRLLSDGITRRRLLDLGLVKDTPIKALYKSPCGDPVAYEIRGTVIALRSEEASKIIVKYNPNKEDTI